MSLWINRIGLAGAVAILLCGRSHRVDGGKPAAPATASRPASATGLATSRSATTQAAVPAFEPLLDAVVGEWAVYSTLDGRELRYSVQRVTGATVAIQVIVRQAGKPLGLPAVREDPRDFDPLAHQAGARRAERRMNSTKIEAAGRKWDAMLYEDRWTDEDIHYVRRTWVSRAAPVLGILRMELHGDGLLEARLELKALGGR